MPRQAIYVPAAMLAELFAESSRSQRTRGWLLRRAWQLARERIAAIPATPEATP